MGTQTYDFPPSLKQSTAAQTVNYSETPVPSIETQTHGTLDSQNDVSEDHTGIEKCEMDGLIASTLIAQDGDDCVDAMDSVINFFTGDSNFDDFLDV